MKEITDIIRAYDAVLKQGKNAALATVVHVEGSSYRRPGARMLVTEDGQLTGAISGGCLEGDALRKALLAMSQQKNKLVTYDTMDEDDAKFGVQLGCNGIVHILFEPIQNDQTNNLIDLLRQLIRERKNAVLVTLFSLQQTLQPGTSLLYRQDALKSLLPQNLTERVFTEVKQVLLSHSSAIKNFTWEGATLNAFVEFIPPPIAIIIAGAGNDVLPVVELCTLLGWHTTVVDGRQTHATRLRFPKIDNVFVAKPNQVLKEVVIDEHTVFVLMTHNYNYDLALLKELRTSGCRYIGILGPKKKMERMYTELKEEGIDFDEQQRSNIYSPVGLDIGAETAEEIAVSIVAEIKAVLAGRNAMSLNEKNVSIHNSIEQTPK
ncbi:MAG: XdhC/CoxI family protein [Bacteroidota bacterium]